VTLIKFIHLLQTSLNEIFSKIVQQLTRFQLTLRVARSLCDTAELLVNPAGCLQRLKLLLSNFVTGARAVPSDNPWMTNYILLMGIVGIT